MFNQAEAETTMGRRYVQFMFTGSKANLDAGETNEIFESDAKMIALPCHQRESGLRLTHRTLTREGGQILIKSASPSYAGAMEMAEASVLSIRGASPVGASAR